MKKSILAGVLIFMFSVSFVFAQTDNTEDTDERVRPVKRENIREMMEQKRSDLKENIEEKRAEVRAQLEERKEERKVRLQEKAQDRVKMALGKIFTRFDAVIVRFEGFLERIESRITKMEEKGIDTTTVTELFEIAHNQVDESAALIIATEAELQDIVEGESSKESLRESLTQVKESLKASQTALKNVVVEIKSSDVDENEPEEENDNEDEN